jgi:hypothetical protein
MRPSASVFDMPEMAGAATAAFCGANVQAPTTSSQLDQHDRADQRADGQILQEALLQLGEIDVEHHDDEEEQHRHRADIDDDEHHRQEFRAHQQEQPRGVEEGEDENSTECTGLRAAITMNAEAIMTVENR